MYTYSVCDDKENVWVMDFLIRGLFRVDKKSFMIECVLSPSDIYKEGIFDVQKLLDWDEHIVIIPVEINRNWVIFNKRTKGLERFCPVDTPLQCVDAVRAGSKIICIPLKVDLPVVVIDMKLRKCTNCIRFYQEDISDAAGGIWNTASYNNTIYFPVRGFRFVGATDGIQAKIVTLSLNEPIAAADLYGGKWWVVTTAGQDLFCIDESGNFVEQFPLDVQFSCIRVIATGRYIFMLPESGGTIHIFDTIDKKITKINTDINKLPGELRLVPYWHYYYDADNIVFLPHSYPCTVVHLDTLEVKHVEVLYKEEFIREYYWKYYGELRISGEQKSFGEDIKTRIPDFTRYAVYGQTKEICGEDGIGTKIWKEMLLQ